MNIEQTEKNYRVDEIGTRCSFAGSTEQSLVQVNGPCSSIVFNCDVPTWEWSKEPKVGDRIKYIQISANQYPSETLEIYINNELVYEREDKEYHYGMDLSQ